MKGINVVENYVRIKSKRICHKHLYNQIGELFGFARKVSGTIVYGVSVNGKDYEFYAHELERM